MASSKLPECQLFDCGIEQALLRFHEVGIVLLSGAHACMAEQELYGSDRHVLFEQVNGEGIAETVRVSFDPGFRHGAGNGFARAWGG